MGWPRPAPRARTRCGASGDFRFALRTCPVLGPESERYTASIADARPVCAPTIPHDAEAPFYSPSAFVDDTRRDQNRV
jgi:hypothetical protein